MFFGRREETQQLIDIVCAHRLVVVTGFSGAGKTSLINAGLLAWTDRTPGEAGVYVRCGDDPIAAIGQAVMKHFQPDHGFNRNEPLTYFLAHVRDYSQVVPFIVVDQAEELFTRIGEVLRDELLVSLRECLTATPLVARFVLVIREDYLVRLAELRHRIPTILQNIYLVPAFNYEGAIAAIREPADLVGVSFSRELADRVLRDLGIETVLPPQVQIVCSRLFEAKSGLVIDDALYESLGGSREILRHYLSDALLNLDHVKQTRQVLKAMVTSEGTKDVLSSSGIARRSGLLQSYVEEILLRLRDEARVLRGVQQDGEHKFELSHEYLTKEIWTWMDQEDITRRQIEELLARELQNWRRFRHLRLGLDRLAILEENISLFENDEESLILVLLSLVKYHRLTLYVTARVGRLDPTAQDRAVSQLFDFFYDRDLVQRREAAEAIALLNPAPVIRALSSPDIKRCTAALEILAGIEENSASVAIIPLLNSSVQQVWELACAALGEIGTPDAVQALFEMTQSPDRERAAIALKALGRTKDQRAVMAIREALQSRGATQISAAQQAIIAIRFPEVFQQLLRDKLLRGRSRTKLWEAIEKAHRAVGGWILDIVEDLPDEDQVKAAMLFNRWSTVWGNRLDQLSKSTTTIGKWAIEKLAQSKTKEVERADLQHRTSSRISNNTKPIEYAELFVQTEMEIVWTSASRLSEFISITPGARGLILPLLQDPRPAVQAGALDAIFRANRDLGMLEPLLPTLLNHDDQTVRYLSCLVAAKFLRMETVEWISRLIDDSSVPRWIYLDVGPTVGEAAAHALDKLHPAWKVWSKPTQISFRQRKP